MKRYLAIAAGLLVLAVAGWGIAWWTGRGGVESAIDEGVARLEAQGWEIAWEDREIGGFPFGYKIKFEGLTATDTDTGLVVTLPWAQAKARTDRIVVRLADSFTAELPVPGPAPAPKEGEAPETTAPVTVTGESDDLRIVLVADGSAEAIADRVSWTIDEVEPGRKITQTVEGLEAVTVPDAPGARYRVHLARLGTEAEIAEPDGTSSTLTSSIGDVTLEGTTTLETAEALGEMLYAGGPGQAQGSLSTGLAEIHVESAGETPGVMDWRAEALSGEAALTSGRIELEGEARGSSWTVASPDPALPVQGQLSIGLARAHYAMPMAPSEKPDAMALGLELHEAVADERVWAQIDPNNALPRGPASLTVELSGTARVTERIDKLSPGAEPPFEIATLVLDEVSAEALGASLNATGQIEILQPVGVPLGEIQVGVTGLAELVRVLGRAGMLAPEMQTMAEAIMDVYLRPAGEDAWTALIEFTRDGALVNGMPVR
jgi:hypothetical protein